MNETKKMKFPVAAIFTALLALGLIENLRSLLLRAGMLDQMIGYRMVVEFGSTHSVPHILYQILLIGSMVLLTVLLFMRKRNGLLSGALAMQALLPAALWPGDVGNRHLRLLCAGNSMLSAPCPHDDHAVCRGW